MIQLGNGSLHVDPSWIEIMETLINRSAANGVIGSEEKTSS